MTPQWLKLCLYPEIKFEIIQHFILNRDLRQNQAQISASLRRPKIKISRYIEELVKMRLLEKEEFGRSLIYFLNEKSILLKDLCKPVMQLNQNFLVDWVHRQIKELPITYLRNIQRILLFGSAAKGMMRPGSDIDLLIIVKTLKGTDIYDLFVANGANDGLNINLQIIPLATWNRKSLLKTFVASARQDGITLWKSNENSR